MTQVSFSLFTFWTPAERKINWSDLFVVSIKVPINKSNAKSGIFRHSDNDR